jgi:hypothetical protein
MKTVVFQVSNNAPLLILTNERLKPKGEESTCLAYTGLLGELEHLKIETRLINKKFPSVMGECVI